MRSREQNLEGVSLSRGGVCSDYIVHTIVVELMMVFMAFECSSGSSEGDDTRGNNGDSSSDGDRSNSTGSDSDVVVVLMVVAVAERMRVASRVRTRARLYAESACHPSYSAHSMRHTRLHPAWSCPGHTPSCWNCRSRPLAPDYMLQLSIPQRGRQGQASRWPSSNK